MRKLFLTAVLSCLPFVCYGNSEHSTLKRYALITASNNGGPTREELRYAESDALNIAKVFNEIGGLNAQDRTLLLSPSKDEFVQVFEKLNQQISRTDSKQKLEFVFYYSGHSDDDGLMFKDGKVSYQTLKQLINGINSDVRIALLDSCQSGAFTRTKGGVRKPPFLINEANRIKGNIILTSASADEAAQESDKIGSSFFTHYLISGLRGAADTSGDKAVTLNEAYNYAFHETLNRTQKTQAGAQHPAYNMQVAGAGDLVLTDLKTLSSTINIPADLTGRFFIHKANGPLVAEINKTVNTDINVALESGRYRVLFMDNGNVYETRTQLAKGKTTELAFNHFSTSKIENTNLRGSSPNIATRIGSLHMFRRNVDNDRILTGGLAGRLKFISSDYIQAAEQENYYTGYSLGYQRILSKNSALTARFFETKGAGVIRGITTDITFGLIGKSMGSKAGTRLFTGIGYYREQLYDVTGEYIATYPKAEKMTESHIEGSYIPVGVQFLENNFVIDFSLHFIRLMQPLFDKDINKGSTKIALSIGYTL